MDFYCKRKTGCLQKLCAFCCTQKRDLLRNDNFEKTIEIYPRIVILKKMKVGEVYCETITIRNTGNLCRKLKFVTEPNDDVTFKINGNTLLKPGLCVSIDVVMPATKKKLVNKSRYFFVIAEHPDIVWEIPFIVLKKEQEIHIPEIICLAKVPANTISNYQFIIYNPQNDGITFSIYSNFEGLTIKPISGTIPAKEFSKILIVGKVPAKSVTSSILVTFKNGKSFKIYVQMEPSNQLIHLSTSELIFEDTFMGLKSQKNIFICNRSNECVSFQWGCNQINEENDTDDKTDEQLIVSDFITIRNKRGCVPAMNSILSIFTFTPPKNFKTNEDEEESQFQVNTVVYLFCPIMGPQSYRVNIIGRILGPNIEITPVEINIDKLYMGQIRCIAFEILNKGPIAGEIYFKRHTDEKEINCTVTPLSVYLRPDAKKSVQLSFYRRDVGKFLTKLIFKIKSGDVLSILLRGTSLPTIVKVYPEIIEFGQIPICIPQKDSITIFNPLPVSVVVEPKIIDKGVENPLILCVDDLNLPLNTRTTTYYSKCHEEFGEEELQNCISDFGSIEESLSARTNISSKISSLFQNKVLDEIPSMTNELLQNLKSIHSQNQIEAGMKIIDESLNCILNHCDYFQELKDNKNYLKKDWKALPCDAKEVAVVEERFYLEPNKSKTLPVFLVPNSCGPSTKIIQFKVYPMGEDYSHINDTINSMYMISTLRLQYKCKIPILEFNNDITFPQPLYVDMENSFTMYFKNIDSVPGFVYFKVIRIEQCGKITVNKNQQKFFIAPGEKAEVACSVVFRKVGNIVLHGIFQLVGKLLDHSFKIEAKLLPPEIEISTKKIFAKQEVLQLTRTRIFITNTCPSVAQFTLSLKHETHQFLEPQGASLAPNQKVLISIFSKFLDPGLYKNILYLNLKHSDNKLIPITFSVEGIPLEFEPNIKLGLDFGTVFRNNRIQEHTINIKNLGEKAYTINFQNKISKKLEIVPKSVFNIEPKFLTIPANAQKTFNIQLDISKEIIFEEEYCVNGVDEAKHRFKLFDFEVKCIVIECKILWSKNEIRFKENGDKAVEVVSLINTTHFVGNVSLNVQGYFLVGTNSTAVTEKSLDFSIQGKSSKEIYVSLNEREVDEPNLICQCLKGYIKCKVNNKTQKSLPLHVRIVNPGLRICNPKVTFFTPYADSFAHINIHNCSLKNAKFIWREIESILDKNISECNVEQLYSKTISELVLSLPKANLPKFPNSIKLQNTEVFICDECDESSDEENESSSLGVHDLKRKLSLMSSKTEEYSKSSSSLTTTTVHSQRGLIQRTSSCKALPISQAQVQNIGINDILENLGLFSLGSNNTFCKDNGLIIGDTNCIVKKNLEESYKIGFQQKTGQISSKSMFQTYVFLPTLPEDRTLECKYGLEVFGGQTEFLDMTITNQKGRIQVSSTSINLGSNIWYKMIIDKIKITSLSPWATKITVIENDDVSNEKSSFANGFVEIISPKEFILPPKTSMNIEFKTATGLNQHFSKDIGLEINKNSTAIPINFRGSGVLPLLSPLNLTRTTQTLIDITENYLYLRDLYNHIQKEHFEEHKKKDDTAQFKGVGNDEIVEENEITRNKIQKRNKAREFVWLNYSEEKYPGVEHIERFLETEKLLSALNKSNDLRTTFQQFYHRCMHNRAMEFDPVVNLKLTICRPIPWEFSAFSLDMKTFKTNETNTFEIELVFEGPGRLFLSCRSGAVIPGLKALFEISQDKGLSNLFAIFQQSPDEKTFKKYKNIQERSSDIEKTVIQNSYSEIIHSHSYDFDEAGVHQRKIVKNKIKHIKEDYTKISQPTKEKKNPLILTEICQATNDDLSNFKLKLYIKYTASHHFYDKNQEIEDYILIDTHLGPTLPILLKGIIDPA